MVATLTKPPESLGVTHWSARLLADLLGVSFASLARIWRKWTCSRGGSRPSSSPPTPSWTPRSATWSVCIWRRRTRRWCCRSTKSPKFRHWTRLAPILPLRPGLPEKQTHDYVRHGTTTLFAALEVATGMVTDACHSPAHPRRDPGVPQAPRQGLPAGAAAHRLRPLRHPLASQDQRLAVQEPAYQHALHPHVCVMAEHRRDLLRHHHPASDPTSAFTSVRDLIVAHLSVH